MEEKKRKIIVAFYWVWGFLSIYSFLASNSAIAAIFLLAAIINSGIEMRCSKCKLPITAIVLVNAGATIVLLSAIYVIKINAGITIGIGLTLILAGGLFHIITSSSSCSCVQKNE